MSCCGQQRRAMRMQTSQAPMPHPRPSLENPTPITYLGESVFVAKGSATGLTYLFHRDEVLNVDERDAPAFIATGIFVASPAGVLLPDITSRT